MEPVDNDLFQRILAQYSNGSFISTFSDNASIKHSGTGIGTLAEKTTHSCLKAYYSGGEEFTEVKVAGYVADICRGTEITEIQTRQFYRMKKKLDAFLPEHDVTIVYPIAINKWISWIDPETGELSKKRKSSHHDSPYKLFLELYSIKEYMKRPGLHFIIACLDVEEYRLQDGYGKNRKIRAHREDGIPVSFHGELRFDQPLDFLMFLPPELPERFTSKDLASTAGIPSRLSNLTLNILYYLEIVERIDKIGNMYVYQVSD